MSEPELKDQTESAPEMSLRLDSHFLMDSNGKVYEIPASDLDGYCVTPEREKEIGHLPFDVKSFVRILESAHGESGEVEGHHLVQDSAGGMWTAHTDWQYGAFIDPSDGSFCVAFHRHPHGDIQVEVAEKGEFA